MSKHSTKLTIGLPVYNSEATVRESVQSLLAQTYGDFILIISDNASTDSTGDICRELAAGDSRIRYHRNAENIGMSPNFNRVAELCETAFFKWSTADDLWEPTMVEKTLAVIEADDSIALCYPKTKLVNIEEGIERPYDDNLHLMQDDPAERFLGVIRNIGLCNLHLGISRTAALRKTRMLQPFPGADLNLVAELALYGKFFEVQEYLFLRRFHEDSSSWARGDAEHQKRRFHSAKTRNIKLNRWRAEIEYIRAAIKAPLPFASKRRVYGYLGRRLIWNRNELARELWAKLSSGFQRREHA